MSHSISISLTSWQNFYVIAGSSAGALTGLQFVVITLVTQARAAGTMRDIRAFATPTIMHFCAALLISALMTAPWQNPASLGISLGVCGLVGLAYSLQALWHARNATYKPDLEDWIWYTAVPFLTHAALLCAGVLTYWNAAWSLMIVAWDTLAYLFLGVRNAWDTVTFIAIGHGTKSSNNEAAQD